MRWYDCSKSKMWGKWSLLVLRLISGKSFATALAILRVIADWRGEKLTSSVKETTLDSIQAGLRTALLRPGVRGVFEEGSKAALQEVERKGGVVIEGQDWVDQLKRWLSA